MMKKDRKIQVLLRDRHCLLTGEDALIVGEASVQVVNEQTSVACEDFCQELAGAKDTSFIRTYRGEPASRIIATSSSLTLLADLSPLCFGHLLLVSNTHYMSFADVLKDHAREVEDVTGRILDLYTSTFGRPVILEHGSSPGMSGSACITHAHWHFLPVDSHSVAAAMDADRLGHMDLPSFLDLQSVTDQQLPYFFVADGRYCRIYGIGRRMRQQYLRSVVGRILGIPDPEWDWALVIRRPELRRTMAVTEDWRFRV